MVECAAGFFVWSSGFSRPSRLKAGLRTGFPEFLLDERQVLLRGRAILFIAEDGISPGHRAQHQAVPRREDFVVQMRPDALAPRVEHFPFRRDEQFNIGRADPALRDRDARQRVPTRKWFNDT